MPSRPHPIAARLAGVRTATAPLSLISSPLVLIDRQADHTSSSAPPRRTKIWELSRYLHCSIIGTCLSASELRRILGKAEFVTEGLSDHELHGQGVTLAGQQGIAAKLLHKALDNRHRQAIVQLTKAKCEREVAAFWREAVKGGDIPGAYWATLTHPRVSDQQVRLMFGEVHMLSHLVGAANRADIRRLNALEAENGALQEKLRRQQVQLREGFIARDEKIRDLSALLARQLANDALRDHQAAVAPSERVALSRLVADLERRLSSETRRRAIVENRLERLDADLSREQDARHAAESREALLQGELAAIEAELTAGVNGERVASAPMIRLDGLSFLYVGGRPHQIIHVRAHAEKLGASFLVHDGGVEERNGVLAGLVSRADVVVFPVDCVSHNAVATVKRLCRQASKSFIPLRSGGVGPFVAALNRFEFGKLRTNAI